MNVSQPSQKKRPVFSSSPNSWSDPKQVTKYDLVPSKMEISIPDLTGISEGLKAHCEVPKGLCNHKDRKTLRATDCSHKVWKGGEEKRTLQSNQLS